MLEEKVKFRVSSALKNLIGKELITDQYVAIFELVKNSFDAYANTVKIIFENTKAQHAKITIIDDGKGMSYKDLVNKWLFVAYSAKSDGTEDIDENETTEREDYRNKLRNKRIFAGAKGVGRFSCDRLGSTLTLTTLKRDSFSKVQKIFVDWEDFEQDSKKEFVDIEVQHLELDNKEVDFHHGTILEITDLRDEWGRDSLKKLKRSLQKLINPNQDNDVGDFSIEIIAHDEENEDEAEKNRIVRHAVEKSRKENRSFSLDDVSGELEYNLINGKVKNTIFEMLGIKSIQIMTSISEDGSKMETTLRDRGLLIYKVVENSPFSISNVKIHLFYLNRLAKSNFTRLMGIEPVNYGSVFMYKNGFRIYPYGEVGEDIFGIDKRKPQGYNRRLGTREIFGRVEIIGKNEYLKESTSRDGGLIKNDSYYDLQDYFIDTIRKLERYVVETIEWGNISLIDDGIEESVSPDTAINKLESVIKKLANSKSIVDIEYDENLLSTLREKQKGSSSAVIKRIQEFAVKNEDTGLLRDITRVDKEIKNIIQSKELAEKDAEESKQNLRHAKEEIKLQKSRSLFLTSVSTLDFDNILSLHHQIGIYSNDIDGQLLYWNRQLNKGKAVTKDDLRKLLESVGFLNKKILSIVKFATKANFNLQSEQIDEDIILYFKQYIENVYRVYTDNPLNIQLDYKDGTEFILRFKPIEISIIIDNLISNSRKANARNITINIAVVKEKLTIEFSDDGVGLDKKIANVNEIFEKGYTTTSGSGLGLYHVKQILEEMNSTISVVTTEGKGLVFLMEVSR
ncbi:ATP-binding protein [Paenibacillus sp. GYB004]|uniref:sensor histidine kinase n=1 Tax=Paenibacillus sp. GYB004 TaxID=2994393 RepID=UPI002F96A2AE